MTADVKIIGKRIKALRTQQNMTQAELAERAGLSNVYISNIETGFKGVSLDALTKIAIAFDLSVVYLLLDELPVRYPKAHRKIAALLADCDIDELGMIEKMLSSYITMLRTEKALM